MDFTETLNTITSECRKNKHRGKVANYIPELGKVDSNKFGIALLDKNCKLYTSGDASEKFSIQSVSKVLSLSLAFKILGDTLWERVGIEPSGDPFNDLALLQQENGKPRNPLINAGAIVISDVLVSNLANPKEDFLSYVRNITRDSTINFDEKIAQSEKKTGFRNYAAANLIKSFGNLENNIDTVLDFYFHKCSLSMSCEQLVSAFFLFANRGKCSYNKSYLELGKVKRINAIMLTSGFYDQAGEFAFKVGLPGKSGVGGGIVAVLPGEFSVATWSPGLNEKGNSKLGMYALEELTTKIGHSIF